MNYINVSSTQLGFRLTRLITAIFIILSINIYAQDNPKTYRYFVIYVKTDDYGIFKKLLDEAYLTDEYGFNKEYQIVVNLLHKEMKDNFVVIGKYKSPDVERDRTAFRYYWEFFSKDVRWGLLNWTGKNKINREKA